MFPRSRVRVAGRRDRRALPRADGVRPAAGGRRVLAQAVRHRGAAGLAAQGPVQQRVSIRT